MIQYENSRRLFHSYQAGRRLNEQLNIVVLHARGTERGMAHARIDKSNENYEDAMRMMSGVEISRKR